MAEWHEGKSVLECNRYMLENEIACDVTFEVGGPDGGATETIHAHKYMLVSRSPVFYSMFCGDLKETGETIKIPDVEANIFRVILQYIYCETVDVSGEQILRVIYASEKYMLQGLTERCEKYMSKNIDNENVCPIWECAVRYERGKLANKAIQYILKYPTDVLKASSFCGLPQELLKKLLSSDELQAPEKEVFEACLRWARQQCLERGEEATGPAVRKALGECLYCIRFPLIDGAECVDLLETSAGLLTEKEEISVLKFHVTGRLGLFRCTPRTRSRSVMCVQRYDTVNTKRMWQCNDGKPDAISFKCDKYILLAGIGVYGRPKPETLTVEIEVLDSNDSIMHQSAEEELSAPSDEMQDSTHVLFPKWLPVPPDRLVTVVQRAWGDRAPRGETGAQTRTSAGVTFRFYNSPESKNGTRVGTGQIPKLLFSEV